MRIGFVIRRKNYYRVLGPVIERALARGWDTECWHDWSQPRSGSRSREFPDMAPAFRHGNPRLRTYQGDGDITRQLRDAPCDAMIALGWHASVERVSGVRWFGLQYSIDVADLVNQEGRARFDGIGLHSTYWASRAVDSFAMLRGGGSISRADEGAIARAVTEKGAIVGFPEMDQYHDIDRDDVRRRLGLEPGRPVVVLAPFPFKSNPRTFWVRHIYGAWNRAHQRLAVALWRRPEYRSHIERGWTDRRVVDAVRAFCDANGAALVVKARPKDPAPSYLERAANIVLSHESYYPATVLEVMSVASLCIHFFSTIAYEAAYAGVPSICIAPSGDDLGFPPAWQKWFLSLNEGESFNFPGVVYPLDLGAVLRTLPTARLSDYPLEPSARARYVEKFIGFDDGKCSDRVLDTIQALVEAKG